MYSSHSEFYAQIIIADKLDGFKKRKRSHKDDDEAEDFMEELTLKEYLQKIEEEYKEEGKPKKKRVRTDKAIMCFL